MSDNFSCSECHKTANVRIRGFGSNKRLLCLDCYAELSVQCAAVKADSFGRRCGKTTLDTKTSL